MKAKFKQIVMKGLKREFGSQAPDDGPQSWEKIANAVSDIAIELVKEIVQNAQVMPGIPVATAGSPAAQSGVTTSPGKIR